MTTHISGGYAKEPPTYGKVLLKTTIGDIDIELWPKQAPKACRNFIQLIMEEYYNNCIFHRIIPNFMAQTGDPTGTGTGGESAYGIPFKDEFHSRLTFSHRGIIAMANSGIKNDNKSQFFITLDKCDWLNRKHTIFGKVTGNTIYNILKFNDLQINKENDKPIREQKIHSIEILLNPFDDIMPRISKTEKLKQNKINKQIEKKNKKKLLKTRGAKNNTKLLAFGDENSETEQMDLIETNNKLKQLKKCKKNENEMIDIIRTKLANKSGQNKRNFSEILNEKNDSDLVLKKRKLNGNDCNNEYELLKQQLLNKRQNENEVDYDDDDDDDEIDGVSVIDKMREQKEEYIKKTRMNKKDRNKFTMNKLNEFKDVIGGGGGDDDLNGKKSGKIDQNTGIEFDDVSDENDDDYDPNWFKSKLEFKKRPQDIEIYSVDDYTTIYGNSKQNTHENKDNISGRRKKDNNRKDRKDRKDTNGRRNDGRREYNRDRNRSYYSNRNKR